MLLRAGSALVSFVSVRGWICTCRRTPPSSLPWETRSAPRGPSLPLSRLMPEPGFRKPLVNTEIRRRGIYLLPNLFTTAALFAGFYAIVMAMNQRFDNAAVAIFVAMILDALDGRVARLTHTQR